MRIPSLVALLSLLLACQTAQPEDSDPVKGRDTSDTSDTSGTDETGETGDSADTSDTSDTSTPDDTDETGDTGEPTDTADTGPTDDTGDTGDTADTGDTSASCGVRVRKVTPADGASDVWFEDDVVFVLSAEDPTATISATLPGITTVDGKTVTFSPDPVMDGSTTYTVALDGCFGSESTTFTTSAFGSVVVDPSGLVDRSWDAQVIAGTWVSPGGVSALLSSYITADMLVGVTAEGSGTLDLRFGATDSAGSAQDLGVNTVEATGSDFSADPRFTANPADAAITINGYDTTMYTVEVTGVFSPSGDSIGALKVSGLADTAPLVPLIDPAGADDALCDLMASLGESCTACPDGTPNCMSVIIEDIPAPELVGVSTAEVTGGSGVVCSTASAALPLGFVALFLVGGRQGRRRK